MVVEAFIRKMLRLKAHRVTAVELGAKQMVIRIGRPKPYIFRAATSGVSFKPHLSWGRAMPFADRTYSTFFALPACTGLWLSEAIRLAFDDITPDGLIIGFSKFRNSRLVPLRESARAGLERYRTRCRLRISRR